MYRKTSGNEKTFCIGGYHVGEYHDFLSKIFCLTVPKNFVEPFCFKKFLASKSFMQRRGISLFSVEFFCPTVPKKFCRPKNSGIENFHASEGRGASWFCRNFCFTGPKNFVRGPFCVSEIFWYGQKFMDKRWGYPVFPSKNLSQCRKIS